MKEKKTFIVGTPEFKDYENDTITLTDGDLIEPSDLHGLDPDRNGGFNHKCTACGEGIMKQYDARWDCARYDCTSCKITVQFETYYIVSIS
jgi:predicted RNA-binding Zn-ribbon protein involved in translation (DUF1610 family)